MEALIIDHQSQNLDILLIQEPPTTAYRTHANHSAWRLYRPTVESNQIRPRSLIYVNRRVSSSSHRQISCNHPDLTAIKIWTADSLLLLFSVYIPPIPIHTPNEGTAEPIFTAIQDTITTALQDNRRSTSIVLSGDFNRHHPTWGGNHIQPRFVEDARELVDFFQVHGLHSCLPRGTPTFWSLSHPGRNSTIDQTVTSRPDLLVKCQLYHENYGSDHRATYSEWSLRAQCKSTAQARKAYDRADWDKIGGEVLRLMGPWKDVKTRPALDDAVERLVEATAAAVDTCTPDLRPTPYSKCWFTADLKTQQTEVNRLRRKWQESCAELGRGHARSIAMFHNMRDKRRAWTRTIEKAKTLHWKQFLDEAGEGKLWKSATYMKPREAWGCIPTLRVGDNELTGNEEKAQAFLDSFFPEMDKPQEGPPNQAPLELPWQPITELEIQRSLKAAKSSTAPDDDGLPTLVWKHLWKHLGPLITSIFTASINLGYHPKRWRSARIVVLRKPGKPDYTIPGACRPISLLNTLGKLLKAVVARRLSYLARAMACYLIPSTVADQGEPPNKPCWFSPTPLTEHGIDTRWCLLSLST